MKSGYIVKSNRLGSKNWTEEEIKHLRWEWGFSSVENIAKHLNRTQIAVVLKAKRLDLGSPYSRRTRYTARKVSDLLGVDIHTVTDYWVGKCGLKAKKPVMKFKRQMFLIEYDNLMTWLQRNQDKWDSRKVKRLALIFEPEWLRRKRVLDSYEPKRKNYKWNKQEDLQLLKLFYEGRKSYKEIAEIMERSHDSVERRLSRIRAYKPVSKGVDV